LDSEDYFSLKKSWKLLIWVLKKWNQVFGKRMASILFYSNIASWYSHRSLCNICTQSYNEVIFGFVLFYEYPRNIVRTLQDSCDHVAFFTAAMTYLSRCGFRRFLYIGNLAVKWIQNSCCFAATAATRRDGLNWRAVQQRYFSPWWFAMVGTAQFCQKLDTRRSQTTSSVSKRCQFPGNITLCLQFNHLLRDTLTFT
jgi:hypothetical protein